MVNLLFFKLHRTAGLALVLFGVIVLLTVFYPVWIFKMALVGRVLLGMAWPQLFQPSVVVSTVSTVWI